MFLDALLRKNMSFVEATVTLHQSGQIPANSYVVDLDMLGYNASHLVSTASQFGQLVFAMTKQLGRSPGVLSTLASAGVDGFVAVDMAGARIISGAGENLSHLGHLVQVPVAETGRAFQMEPDFWTIFSIEKARRISDVASRLDRVQDVLVRVIEPQDQFYSGHEGGTSLENLPALIKELDAFEGIRFAGVTTFPALLFDRDRKCVRKTANVETLGRAAEIARRAHPDIQIHINAPGTTSSAVLSQLAEIGATQVEPGHGLTGTTPLHAFENLPEQPAVCYLSEISHDYLGTPFCFGGGLYVDPVFGEYETRALIAHDAAECSLDTTPVALPPPESIDYYAKLEQPPGRVVAEGASVVFGFRAQAFVTRANIVGVTGVHEGNVSVAGVWDMSGRLANWNHES